MIVFLGGPLLDRPDHNKTAFDAAEQQFTNVGHVVINPARRGIIPGWGWQKYMRLSIADLIQADAIHMLDGWRTSRGALLEKRIADELGLPTINPETR